MVVTYNIVMNNSTFLFFSYKHQVRFKQFSLIAAKSNISNESWNIICFYFLSLEGLQNAFKKFPAVAVFLL